MSIRNAEPAVIAPHRQWLTVGIVVTVIAVTVGGFFLYRSLAGSKPASTEQHTDSYTHPISLLVVKSDSGNIAVSAGDAGKVTVTQNAKWADQRPNVTQQWTGDTLTITATCPDKNNCQVEFAVTLPATAAVQTQVRSGDISVAGLAGSLDLSSTTGEFTVADVSGPLRIAGGSGDVKGSGLRSTDVTAQHETGTIDLGFVVAPRSAAATTRDSGDVTITVPALTDGHGGYNVQATTGNGDRKVGVTQDSNGAYSVNASTADGDVTVNYG